MKILRKIALFGALATFSLNAAASDFGTWIGAEANKKVGLFSFEFGTMFKAQNNLKNVDRWDASFGVSYKPFKFLKFSVGYSYLYSYKMEERRNHYDTWEQANPDGSTTIESELDGYNINKPYWRSKNRFKFDITGNVDLGNFNISLRERYQFTILNSVSYMRDRYRINEGNGEIYQLDTDKKSKSSSNRNRLRSQLKVEYNIPKCKIDPFAYAELSHEMDCAMKLGKTRIGAGADYKINKKNRISFGYIYQDERDSDMGNTQHAVEISYKIKF